MRQEVLCDHSQITQFHNKKGVLIFECCSTCGLDPTTPPLVCYPGELLPWWDRKPTSKKLIDANRPGINRWHDYRSHLREQINLIAELLLWEDEMGEERDPALVAEYEALVEERQRTSVQWPTSV